MLRVGAGRRRLSPAAGGGDALNELKRLWSHSSHYLTGRFAVMALTFVSFPIFTRVFSVAEYGILSLVLKTVVIATALAKMGMQNAVQRFYAASVNEPDSEKRFYSTMFLTAVAASAGVAAAFL